MSTLHVELNQEELDTIREALALLAQKRREDVGVVKLVEKWLDRCVG